MPLFELLGDSARGKLDPSQEKSTDLSFFSENEFLELTWENGLVMTQGQSSRPKKNNSFCGLPSYTLPSHSPKPCRDRDTSTSNGGAIPSSSGKFASFESGLNEFSGVMCDDDGDDDIVPWFNYPINEFLPELSGVTVNENSFDAMKRISCNSQVYKDSNAHPEHEGVNQMLFPSFRAKSSENAGTTSTSTAIRQTVTEDSSRLPHSTDFVNFSLFSRPKAIHRSNGGKNCVIPDSGPPGLETAGFSKQQDSASNGINPAKVKPAIGSKPSEGRPAYPPPPSKHSKGICLEDGPRIDRSPDENGGASTSKEHQDVIEPVVASSVCSGNGVDEAPDHRGCNLKRKSRDNYDSETPSEDVEEDSVGLQNAVPSKGSGSKRSRAAEVHNLSERRRRDRINEKMRALQELIPNCNKADKASMLDEAIEYLKTLQLQVQMMSMGTGLYMPPMMLPGGIQPIHPAHMMQFQAMGIRMAHGFGGGIGSSACPPLQIPHMQGGHFPSMLMPGHPALHGMAGPNYPVIGLPGQGLPMSMPLPPLVPFPGGPVLKSGAEISASATADVAETAEASISKEIGRSMEGTGCSINQTPSQGQATNGGYEKSSSLQFSSQISGNSESLGPVDDI